jgi:hypothetical protein
VRGATDAHIVFCVHLEEQDAVFAGQRVLCMLILETETHACR